MKRTYVIPLIAVLLLALGAALADAQTQKAGINSAAFLKVGVGARQAAIGSAVTSLNGDATNMFWNPAGVALKDESAQAAFTYNNWIGGLSQEAVAASYNWTDVGTIGIGFQSFGINGIQADRDNGYTESALQSQVTDMNTTSTYDYQDLLIQATYSRYITDYLTLGVSAKYIHEKIDDVGAGTFGFDLGTVYNIGVLGWSVGARINNLGGDMKFYDYASRNGLLSIESMTDEGGHQLPKVIYPGLDRAELVDWVERFYGEYYFRPRVIWRVVRKSLWDGSERRRLYKEAREYLALRSKRKKFVAAHKHGSAALSGEAH